ncbi:uncharacterized protein C12orf40-like isoform X1 [Acipenser ruthenus]|uniref:uncharacterized protein C12orf40-like isoform X1 n=1 Tax=Acipenser ruthenus TaxID=7906 RepID=UPI00274036A0|nr:uncharacterized protein C12orf40-like isoform X1 [Acipenser ruthenus]
MNWVGGSRSRFMFKNDTRKQKEFFEKKKLQKKMKLLGISASPQKDNAGSMDLVTLFVVNQISAKKENSIVPKKAVLVDINKGAERPVGQHALELPMSPCAPSRLCLEESQPHHSIQDYGLGRKKKHFSKGVNLKYRQLSPVMESKFSDCSNIDYQCRVTDNFSPYTSSASCSSLLKYPTKENLQTNHPWESFCNEKEQTQFMPFSHPRGNSTAAFWMPVSNGTQQTHQQQSTLQFGSTLEKPKVILQKKHMDHSSFLNTHGDTVVSSETGQEVTSSGIQREYIKYHKTVLEDRNKSSNFLNIETQQSQSFYCKNDKKNRNEKSRVNKFSSNAGVLSQVKDTIRKDSVAECKDKFQDRKLKMIFTDPEQVFFTRSRRSDEANENILQMKESPCSLKEKKEKAIGSENYKQKINFEGSTQLDSRISRRDVAETRCSSSEFFLLEAPNRQESEQILNYSFLSNESPTYSPRESCFSTNSDSDEHGQNLQREGQDECNIQEAYVFSDSFLSSESPTYSPRESCFSRDSDEDGQNVQREGQDECNIQEAYGKAIPATAFSTKSDQLKTNSRANETDDLHTHEKKSSSRIRNNEDQDQFVPLQVKCRLQSSSNDQIRNVGTQTDIVLIFSGKSDIATQCNLVNDNVFVSEQNHNNDKPNVTTRRQTSPINNTSEPRNSSVGPKKHSETEYLCINNFTAGGKQNNSSSRLKSKKNFESKSETNTGNCVNFDCGIPTRPRNSKTKEHLDSQKMSLFVGNYETKNVSCIQTVPRGLDGDTSNLEGNVNEPGLNSQHFYGENLTSDYDRITNGKLTEQIQPETKVKRNSEETKTLHEIADILLMLGHKK